MRTYADDIQRAQSIPASAPVAPVPQSAPAPVPQQVADTAAQIPAEEKSHLSDEGTLLDIRSEASGEGKEGTIVRDTIANRWSLSRAVGESLTNWMGKQAEAVQELANPTEPEPTVAPARTRAAVIKAARAEGVVAPRDDRRAVVEKLRTFAQDAARATQSTQTPQERVPDKPQWASVADAERAAAEAATARAAQAPQPVVTPPEPIQKKAVEKLLAIGREHQAHAPEAPSRDIEFTPPQLEETAPLRTYRDDAVQEVKTNKRSVSDIAAAEAKRREKEVQAVAPSGMSARPFVVAGMVITLFIILGGVGFFWYVPNTDLPTESETRIPALVSTDSQTAVPFSTNRATLLESLRRAATEARSGTVQLSLAYRTDGAPQAVPTSDFMFVLDPRAPGSFIRNLEEDMMFGAQDREPFIIFKTSQFDTAFAGMLDWEPYLSADFAPLFGEPVSRTFIPSTRTADQTTQAQFVDETVENVDVRILRDEEGEERIVYAFPDRRTILITSSTEALRDLLRDLR